MFVTMVTSMSDAVTRQRNAWLAYENAVGRMTWVTFGSGQISVAEPTVAAWQALAAVFDRHGYVVRPLEVRGYEDGLTTQDGERYLHALGIALDVNWTTNPSIDVPNGRSILFSAGGTQAVRSEDVKFGRAETDMTAAMIDDVLAIKTRGGETVFAWGGRSTPVRHPMQFVIDVTPDQLGAGLAPLTTADGRGVSDRTSARFQTIQTLTEKWRGIAIPSQPGASPTRFGVAQSELAVWRRRAVSADDLKALKPEEASEILFAKHWGAISGEDVPLPVAFMLYLGALRHGAPAVVDILRQAVLQQEPGIAPTGPIDFELKEALGRVDVVRVISDWFDAYERAFPPGPAPQPAWVARLGEVRLAALDLADPLYVLGAVEAEIGRRVGGRRQGRASRGVEALELIADELARLRAEATLIRKIITAHVTRD